MYPGISQFCRRKQRKQSMRNEAIHQKRDLILCFPFSTKSGTGSRESGLWRNEPCTLQRSSKTVISRRHCCTPFSMKSVRGSKDYSRWRNEVCVAWSNPKQRDQSARGLSPIKLVRRSKQSLGERSQRITRSHWSLWSVINFCWFLLLLFVQRAELRCILEARA